MTQKKIPVKSNRGVRNITPIVKKHSPKQGVSKFIPNSSTDILKTKKHTKSSPPKEEKKCRIVSATTLIQDPSCIEVLGMDCNVILCPYFFEDIKQLRRRFSKYPYYEFAVKEALTKLEDLQNKKSLSKGKIEIKNTNFALYSYGLKNIENFVIPKDDPITGIENFINYLKVTYQYDKVSYITKDPERRTELITNGIVAEDYRNDQTDLESSLVYEHINATTVHQKYQRNTYFIDKNRIIYFDGNIHPVPITDTTVFGIKPKNLELETFMHALLNPKIRLITVQGPFGAGKTFSPVLAALKLITNKFFDKFMVTRAMVPLEGEESLGAVPGDAAEKIAPWMGGVFDNLEDIEKLIKANAPDELLLQQPKFVEPTDESTQRRSRKKKTDKTPEPPKKTIIDEFKTKTKPNPIVIMRGNSLNNTIFFIDEAQNLFRTHMRVLLSRLSMSSKVIIAGDNSQIDHPHLDAKSNGFTRAIKHYLDEPYAVHIILKETERSDIAKKAVSL